MGRMEGSNVRKSRDQHCDPIGREVLTVSRAAAVLMISDHEITPSRQY